MLFLTQWLVLREGVAANVLFRSCRISVRRLWKVLATIPECSNPIFSSTVAKRVDQQADAGVGCRRLGMHERLGVSRVGANHDPGIGSQQTLRWREMDSNLRF